MALLGKIKGVIHERLVSRLFAPAAIFRPLEFAYGVLIPQRGNISFNLGNTVPSNGKATGNHVILFAAASVRKERHRWQSIVWHGIDMP